MNTQKVIMGFTEFSKQMREHGSGAGIVFGIGGNK